MKHKHEQLIHAWADGAKIEPDVITRIHVTRHNTTTLYVEPNLRLTFDGETGKLKSAEVLN